VREYKRHMGSKASQSDLGRSKWSKFVCATKRSKFIKEVHFLPKPTVTDAIVDDEDTKKSSGKLRRDTLEDRKKYFKALEFTYNLSTNHQPQGSQVDVKSNKRKTISSKISPKIKKEAENPALGQHIEHQNEKTSKYKVNSKKKPEHKKPSSINQKKKAESLGRYR